MDARKVSQENWASKQAEIKNTGRGGRGLGSRPARMTVDVGLSLRMGCRCHFNVITCTEKEDVILVSWVERRHVDMEGQICHGMLDPSSKLTNTHIAPKLSRECVLFVERKLRCGVPSLEILAEHRQRIASVVRQEENGENSKWTRDMQLSSADIRNIQARLRREGHVYHQDDANAVRQWTQRYPELIIHYQEQSRKLNTPFSLVFCSQWMLKCLAEFGHRKAICLDATHGTNRYGFQLFTWMVYDKHQNGIPVVWALLERHRAEDLQVVQQKIKEMVEEKHADIIGGSFQPSCFLTDDSAEEKASIRMRMIKSTGSPKASAAYDLFMLGSQHLSAWVFILYRTKV
ncbi:hypothetical protein R1sor_004557 [Riccia sorocarpa]|uniref:ZSWIM1/3 RNaseH-like domain-containing protein n=1 Tax=Riccia sorocarpa TaxID=122646 RepID=A0ABD3HJ95_9MARC